MKRRPQVLRNRLAVCYVDAMYGFVEAVKIELFTLDSAVDAT
jgi:hypothetical protein